MVFFSLVIAVVFFLVGFLLSPGVSGPSLSDRLLCGAMSGGVTFFASHLLCARDKRRFQATRKRVRSVLSARSDLSDDEFCNHVVGINPEFALDVRESLSQFFSVPRTKIFPSDSLSRDLLYQTFEPTLHMFVIERACIGRTSERFAYVFPKRPIETVTDFIREVQAVVEKLA